MSPTTADRFRHGVSIYKEIVEWLRIVGCLLAIIVAAINALRDHQWLWWILEPLAIGVAMWSVMRLRAIHRRRTFERPTL